MASHQLAAKSRYYRQCLVLVTKHAKSIAIAPVFSEKLGMGVIEYLADTDVLGTFSGEIERKGDAAVCVRQKCEWACDRLGDSVRYVLSSEGSFGPHPLLPFTACDHEILHFIDKEHEFSLTLSCLSEKTNYFVQELISVDELYQFAERAHFPSHAIILRSCEDPKKAVIFKGINEPDLLVKSFEECVRYAQGGKIFASTDMRAQYNPSRMQVIASLADELADRLLACCPNCGLPGWGEIRREQGLPCGDCATPTEGVKYHISGCVKCSYQEVKGRPDGKMAATAAECASCNP